MAGIKDFLKDTLSYDGQYQIEVITKINNNEIDNLLEVDWKRATYEFDIPAFRLLILSLDNSLVREYAIKACLNQYQCDIISNMPSHYMQHWKVDDHFQEFAESLIELVRESDLYNIKRLKSTSSLLKRIEDDVISLKNVVYNDIPKELSTPQAIEYLGRLVKYCDENHRWKDKTQKTQMCQVAHIISGLLDLQTVKWKPFEDLWDVTGLANAYSKRNGRAIDKEFLDLFPEFSENPFL